MKKIVLPGIAAGVAIFILAMLINYAFMLLPSVAADYKNHALMRSFQDPLASLFFIYPVVQGIILAWAWDKSKTLFKGTMVNRGIKFGFVIWLIASVPGMIMSYSSFQTSLLTVISWTVNGLVGPIAAGLVFAKLNK
jgi:hypothetical protein